MINSTVSISFGPVSLNKPRHLKSGFGALKKWVSNIDRFHLQIHHYNTKKHAESEFLLRLMIQKFFIEINEFYNPKSFYRFSR